MEDTELTYVMTCVHSMYFYVFTRVFKYQNYYCFLLAAQIIFNGLKVVPTVDLEDHHTLCLYPTEMSHNKQKM